MKAKFLIYLKICLCLGLVVLLQTNTNAQDTTFVQTLSFDSITARRGVWKFPTNPNEYRQILMYHTLKCDPNRIGDYPCGEWDYLTYSFVYKGTGVYDSAKVTKKLYKVGKLSPDTILTASNPVTYTKIYPSYTRNFLSATNENTFEILKGSANFKLDSKVFRSLFDVTAAEIKASGIKKGPISKIKLFVQTPGTILKNVKVKMGSPNSTGLSVQLLNSGFLKTYYTGDLAIDKAGYVEIPLINDYNWPGLGGIQFDISFESAATNPGAFAASDDSLAYFFNKPMQYLNYKDFNSFVTSKNIPALNPTKNLTFEGWVRVDQWSNWATVFGQGENTLFQLGDTIGRLYCIIRTSKFNSYGYITGGINIGEWTHIAMTYDANEFETSKKLKCYINGKPVKLTFNYYITNSTESTKAPFSICSGSAAYTVFKGAFKDIRAWNTTLDSSTIRTWKNKYIDASHPNYSNLQCNFKLDDTDGFTAKDSGPNSLDGIYQGSPLSVSAKPEEMFLGELSKMRPNIAFVQGEYQTKTDTTQITETTTFPKFAVSKFKIVNRYPVLDSTIYTYIPGRSIVDNQITGLKDTISIPSTGSFLNSNLEYFDNPFEKLDKYEIGRFITPYGINLDLGPKGFTWIYDVTDYAPLLTGDVDFAAGNNQELIDVKFAFIKGTPPRNVLNITKIAGAAQSFSYKDLDQDNVLYETDYNILPNTKTVKIKTRLTGHGHNSNTGNAPHCCEWKDNEHYLYLNGEKAYSWHIWQELDCALNPVFPQGGTWPGSREGWCPGDRVKDHDFEVTNYIEKNILTFDYAITPVPEDNAGMGNGNYVTNIDLIEYTAPNFALDAEVYNVFTPNDMPLYSRMNPICAAPKIVVRNNGSETITSMLIEYGVSGANNQTYNWTGKLASMALDTVTLPVPNTGFWLGDKKNIFTATVKSPNGKQDLYAANDSYSTSFKMPDVYKTDLYLYYLTNKRPETYVVEVLDMTGKQVYVKTVPASQVLYKEKLDLAPGCYVFKVTDIYKMGLSYWAYKDQGNGYVKFANKAGTILKSFNPDFGHQIYYAFTVSDINYVQDANLDALLNVYPNPVNDELNIRLDETMGESLIRVYDIYGRLALEKSVNIIEGQAYSLSMSGLSAGGYVVKVSNGTFNLAKEFIKK